MPAYLSGVSREQVQLLPECLEDYVSATSIARVIDAFVETLPTGDQDDDCLPPEREMSAAGGRLGYDPRALAKLLIWGYIKRLRSTRVLEEQARLNLEAVWLLRKLTPDHSSISRFRKANHQRIKLWLKQFNLVCGQLNLLGGEEIAIDGVFLKAVNSRRRNHRQEQLEKRLAKLETEIDGYLEALDKSETAPTPVTPAAANAGELQAQLEELQEARQKAKALLDQAKSSPTGQASETDPDSRLLNKASAPGGAMVGYLAQSAVDGKTHLIAATEVTQQGNDKGQLTPMATAANEVITEANTTDTTDTTDANDAPMTVLGDGGYFDINDLHACENAGFKPCVATYPQRRADAQAGRYPTTDFKYDSVTDCYRCPQDQELSRHGSYRKGNSTFQTYYNTKACRQCPARAQCVKGRYRKIHRHEHQGTVDRMRVRQAEQPEMYGRRAGLVEHPFGSMMFWNQGRTLLCRGLDAARAEFSLSALAYNLKRALKEVGIKKLLAAVA